MFFGATFAVTWPCFAAVAILSHRMPDAGANASVQALLLFIGVFAPGFVAIGLTAQESGTAGVAALLKPLLAWRSAPHLYGFALGFMAAVKLTVAILHRLVLGTWPTFGAGLWYLILAATVLSTVLGGQAGEEVGWRGYALPRLAGYFGYTLGSVVLGMVWAVWHLPSPKPRDEASRLGATVRYSFRAVAAAERQDVRRGSICNSRHR
ncbi:MAG: CPBP family intramembrane glutamic endopeptidase [Thermoanaerobaculia bacterium]